MKLFIQENMNLLNHREGRKLGTVPDKTKEKTDYPLHVINSETLKKSVTNRIKLVFN